MDVRQVFDQFQNKMPDQAASMMLTHFKGDRRATEVEAWKMWTAFAGGEVNKRPREKSPECQYLQLVIRSLVDRTELPRVAPPAESIKPADAVPAPFLLKPPTSLEQAA